MLFREYSRLAVPTSHQPYEIQEDTAALGEILLQQQHDQT